jgi:hypothetical protein
MTGERARSIFGHEMGAFPKESDMTDEWSGPPSDQPTGTALRWFHLL